MIEKKKIGFVIPSLGSGGAERVIVTLANYFCDQFNVYLIVLFKTSSCYDLNQDVHKIYLKNEYSESTNFIQALRNNYLYFKKLLGIVEKHQIELLISFTTSVNVLSIITAKIKGVKCIVSERNNPVKTQINFFWSALRKYTYPFANLIVVQTSYVKDYYESYLNSVRISIIPNPINDKILSERETYDEERENIILTVGRLDENKNHKLLIEAFSDLNFKDWRLVIVGDGILRDELRFYSQKLEVERDVEFVGNVSNISEYYNNSKIFAFTSNSEGFPNVLLEALASGLPCVSTNCPSGPSDLINHGINGFLIKVGDKEKLKESLAALVNDETLRKCISEESLKSSIEFKTDNIAKKWEGYISNLI